MAYESPMINEHVYLISKELILLPYLAPFVPRYHEWMCNPELLAATESEPLSFEEEQENQCSWLHATDKMTFILLAPLTAHPQAGSGGECNGACRDREGQQQRRDDSRARLVSLRGAVPPLAEVFVQALSSPGDSHAFSCRLGAVVPYPGCIVTAADHTSFVPKPHSPHGMHSASGNAFPLLKRYVPSRVKGLFSSEVSSASQSQGAYGRGDEAERLALAQSYVMIGDCNLFLLEENDDNDDARDFAAGAQWRPSGQQQERHRSPTSPAAPSERSPPLSPVPTVTPSRTFEVEVMVADTAFRRRGFAETAVRMIMQYAVAVCGATRFVAKILNTNTSSIALFTERLKFAAFKEVKVFHEVHLARSLKTEDERRSWELECRHSRCERAASSKASLQIQRAICESCAAASSDGSKVAERTEELFSKPPTLSQPAKCKGGQTYWCAPLSETVASSIHIYTHAP
ncbi:hypothetical protein LSCM4_01803 [Leishmania orientalis]|uniref:N-acetyltransferase domain-containing protein n=1 Tax=Leishmania orientalis TaxID=2249476 RepID=A0A836GUA8_9TRYP|nr:hypothetical protein LSCM4_01803 [Leishmania orientalis]